MIEEGRKRHPAHHAPAPMLGAGTMQVLAPTFLEYVTARYVLSGVAVVHAGVALSRWIQPSGIDTVIICGLAGSLNAGLPPGTVVIPDEVGVPEGRTVRCDAVLMEALHAAARELRFDVAAGRLLTSPALITGSERQEWAQRGFIAADMETGLLAGTSLRIATVRVILDAPGQGISKEWLRPGRAMLRPALWRELLWLGRSAPLYATRGARVLQTALRFLGAEANG